MEDFLLQCFCRTIAPLRNPYKHKRFCAITSITPVGRWTRTLDISIPHCIPLFCLCCFVLLALVCLFVSGDAYVFAYPYAWTVNFEMRLEGIDSACISACRSECISARNSVSMSADGSNFMLASISVDILIVCRRSKNVPFSSTTLYQNLDFLAPKHKIPKRAGLVSMSFPWTPRELQHVYENGADSSNMQVS